MPSELLPTILIIAISLLTIVLVVAGIYVVVVLRKVAEAMDRVNNTLDMAEVKINSIISPFQSLVGMSSSLGTGLKVFESFTSWLNKNKHVE